MGQSFLCSRAADCGPSILPHLLFSVLCSLCFALFPPHAFCRLPAPCVLPTPCVLPEPCVLPAPCVLSTSCILPAAGTLRFARPLRLARCPHLAFCPPLASCRPSCRRNAGVTDRAGRFTNRLTLIVLETPPPARLRDCPVYSNDTSAHLRDCPP